MLVVVFGLYRIRLQQEIDAEQDFSRSVRALERELTEQPS